MRGTDRYIYNGVKEQRQERYAEPEFVAQPICNGSFSCVQTCCSLSDNAKKVDLRPS
jgi:hypothetical protein